MKILGKLILPLLLNIILFSHSKLAHTSYDLNIPKISPSEVQKYLAFQLIDARTDAILENLVGNKAKSWTWKSILLTSVITQADGQETILAATAFGASMVVFSKYASEWKRLKRDVQLLLNSKLVVSQQDDKISGTITVKDEKIESELVKELLLEISMAKENAITKMTIEIDRTANEPSKGISLHLSAYFLKEQLNRMNYLLKTGRDRPTYRRQFIDRATDYARVRAIKASRMQH